MKREGAKFVLATGTARYDQLEDLPGVVSDLAEIRDLFDKADYQVIFAHSDPTAQTLRQEMVDWRCRADRSDDALIFYYSGHGDREGNRHYLLCRDSRAGALAGTAVATEDLIRILTEQGVRRLLMIIDTCYAGGGAVDAIRGAAEDTRAYLAGAPGADAGQLIAFSIVASARAREFASDGAFPSALRQAIEDESLGGQRQRFLYLKQVVDRINEEFRRRGELQHATWSTLCDEPGFDFIPNPRYREDLPAEGIDLAEQWSWRKLQDEDLLSHFSLRGHGSDGIDVAEAHYFTGRHEVLRTLSSWLNGDGESSGMVVTGAAGTGKSAVLGRLVILSDPTYRRSVPPESIGSGDMPNAPIDIAFHARRRTLDDLVARIGGALGLPAGGIEDLLNALGQRHEPLRIVIDAVDEAGPVGDDGREAVRIALTLLRPMAEISCVRLIVGARTHILHALGNRFACINLDDERWIRLEDLVDYTRALLLAPHGPRSTSVYEEYNVGRTSQTVARQAYPNFLVARLTARALAARPVVADPADLAALPSARLSMPRTPAEPGMVFRWALDDQAGATADRIRDLLTPLAYAHGAGLPWFPVWAGAASALTGLPVSVDELTGLLDIAGSYVVEGLDKQGRSVYRLYHESFAEDLRATAAPDAAHLIVGALIDLVPIRTGTNNREWAQADPYLLAHLAEHAGAAGELDRLVTDGEYLLHAQCATLRRAFVAVRTPQARRIRQVYEQCVQWFYDDRSLMERRSILHLSAVTIGVATLADQLFAGAMRWRVRWARWEGISTHRRIGNHGGKVTALAWAKFDGAPMLVTGDELGALHVWDYTTGDRVAGPISAHEGKVDSLSILPIERSIHCVSVGEDRKLRQLDLLANIDFGPTIEIQPSSAAPLQVVAACVDDSAIAAVGHVGRVSLWHLSSGERIASHGMVRNYIPTVYLRLTVWHGSPAVLAFCTIHSKGQPSETQLGLISLAERRAIKERRRESPPVMGEMDGRPLAVHPRKGIGTEGLQSHGGPWGREVGERSIRGFISADGVIATWGGRSFAVERDNQDVIVIWDLATGLGMPAVHAGGTVSGDAANTPVVLADGDDALVAAASGRTVTTFEAQEAHLAAPPRRRPLHSTFLAPGSWRGRPTVTVDIDEGSLVVLDLATGELLAGNLAPTGVQTIIEEHPHHVDTRFLLPAEPTAGGKLSGAALTQTRRSVLDLVPTSLGLVRVQRGIGEPVARVTNLATGQEETVDLDPRMRAWAATAVGEEIVLCAGKADILIANSTSGGCQWRREIGGLDPNPPIFVAETNGMPTFVVAARAGFLYLVSARDGEYLVPPIPVTSTSVRSIDVRAIDGLSLLAAGSSDYIVNVWDLQSLRQIVSIDVGSLIEAVRFTDDQGLIVYARQGVLCIDLSPSLARIGIF